MQSFLKNNFETLFANSYICALVSSPEESISFPEQELLHQNDRATNLNYQLLCITFSNIFIQSPRLYLELQMTKGL